MLQVSILDVGGAQSPTPSVNQGKSYLPGCRPLYGLGPYLKRGEQLHDA